MIENASRRAESEQRRLIVDAAENAMLVIDMAGTIELANAEAERIFGYAPGALEGRPAQTLGCPEISAAVTLAAQPQTVLDPLVVSAYGGGSIAARPAGGATVAIEIASKTLISECGPLVLISVRRRHKATPRGDDDRSERDSPVVEPTPHEAPATGTTGHTGAWRLDCASGELSWSAEVYRIYGLPATDPPTLENAIAGYHPGDRDRVRALAQRALAEGIAYRDEARIVRPDGSMRVVIHGGSAERAADGSIVAVSGFFEDVTERKNAQRERERLNEFLMVANQSGKIGIWELDLRTNVSVWDANMYALYGIGDTTIAPTFELWIGALHPHDRADAAQRIQADIAEGTPSDTDFRVIWENGETHHIRSLVTMVRDPDGSPTRIIGTDWDVTEIRSLGEQLREEKEALIGSEARYRALTEAMPQMVWVIDAAGHVEYVNGRWCRYTGLLLEQSSAALDSGVIDMGDARNMSAIRTAEPAHECECEARIRRFDGFYRWHLVRSVPFRDATGATGKWIITATDIEERKAAEKKLAATVAELEHLAHHDPMTNLPNRVLLMDRLERAIVHANRERGGVIVLYVDLDRFKAINDSYGHDAGDRVLRETGVRIVDTLRAGDTASRVGGDEFILVCTTPMPESEIARIATRLLAAITVPIDICGEAVTVEASIGVSVYPADGSDAETLIRKADAAMYSAKQHGRNAFHRYSTEKHISIVAAAEFEAELRHAIATGELVAHFQPIVDLRSGRPVSAEALVRWNHPQRGLVLPGGFIAFAEERGLIGQIGDVVLRAACAMLERLRELGHPDVSIGVNASAHQFGKPGFVESVVEALARYATDPRRLAIEITESTVMGNTRATAATLRDLHRLGVNLSIDDFGTGYSSLAYIKRFPIDTLKIDRTFVRDVAHDQADQAIAKTIVTLAHSLGMNVVAEGVETAVQWETLAAFGVDRIQGYRFSRPLAPDRFLTFIAGDRARSDDRLSLVEPLGD